jgi:hypothetical protein
MGTRPQVLGTCPRVHLAILTLVRKSK